MEEILKQTLLYDFYGELLTEHQKQVYEDVILNDYSLSEVAASLGISRQGVHDMVRRSSRLLEEYEACLLYTSEKGVRVLDSKEELEALTEGTVIIRSHGVGREIYDLIQEKGLICVDATCPFVKKIHRTVEKESAAGRQIIIIGNDKHPEVEGIKGWCHTPAIVVESSEQAEALELAENLSLIHI